MFEKCKDIDWIEGFGLWDWKADLYEEKDGAKDDGYEVYGKPACDIIREYYRNGG